MPTEQAAEFSGRSSTASLGDLSAFFSTPANGTWQLEVTNADSNHSLTLSNWSLFVATSALGQTAFQILGWGGVSLSDGLADISFDRAAV